MTNSSQTCAVVSLRDIELEGQVSCVRRRLVVIAPGLSESVAKAIVKWHELGRDGVLVVVDPDPEVCRLGLGDLTALQMLQETAEQVRRPNTPTAGLKSRCHCYRRNNDGLLAYSTPHRGRRPARRKAKRDQLWHSDSGCRRYHRVRSSKH
jgi:hypothetical protein